MPSYISHAIMGEKLLNNLNREKILNLEINADSMKTFCISSDLAFLSKSRDLSHNQNTKIFFYNMIKYIIDNRLYDNSEAMTLLYGHIAHYFFDINAHPFIYYIERGLVKSSIFSNHRLLEGYLDSYLLKKIKKLEIGKADIKNYCLAGNITHELKILINNVYYQTYKIDNISKSYISVLATFRLIESIINSPFITKSSLIYLSNFKNILKENNIDIGVLSNENNNIWLNPVSGKIHNDSFIQLFYKSIDESLIAIDETNKTIYNRKPLSNLDKIFLDLSYDTGLSCQDVKKMIFHR